MAFVQTAVLHTTAAGERRVRVMNLSIPITSHIGNIFRFADFDASLLQIVKEGELAASILQPKADVDYHHSHGPDHPEVAARHPESAYRTMREGVIDVSKTLRGSNAAGSG